jgi:hypothetical protein
MPQNLGPQTTYIAGNRNAIETKKTKDPTEILQSEAELEVWGIKINHKAARCNYP